jgi:hypothetical protein
MKPVSAAPIFWLNPRVEVGGTHSTCPAMTRARTGPTVPGVSLIARIRDEPPLRLFGAVAMTLIVVVCLLTDPRPGLHGDGPWVALGITALVVGIVLSIPRATAARTKRSWPRSNGRTTSRPTG